MFGSHSVILLALLLDSSSSWAESASRWDFTFLIYSVPAGQLSARVNEKFKYPPSDSLMSSGHATDLPAQVSGFNV